MNCVIINLMNVLITILDPQHSQPQGLSLLTKTLTTRLLNYPSPSLPPSLPFFPHDQQPPPTINT